MSHANVGPCLCESWFHFCCHVLVFSHLEFFVDEEMPKGLLISPTDLYTSIHKRLCIKNMQESTSNCLFISREGLEPIVHYLMDFSVLLYPRVITIYRMCSHLIEHYWIKWQRHCWRNISFLAWNKNWILRKSELEPVSNVPDVESLAHILGCKVSNQISEDFFVERS